MLRRLILLTFSFILAFFIVGCGRSDIESQAIKYYKVIDDYMMNGKEIPDDIRSQIKYYTEKIDTSDLKSDEYNIVIGINKMFYIAEDYRIGKSVGVVDKNTFKEYEKVKNEVSELLNIE